MNSINKFVDDNFDNMISDLKRLISINSVWGEKEPDAPFGKSAKQALLEMLKICEEHGLKTQNFDNYVGTAQWGDNPKLGILSHLDIVPVDNNWDTDPFDAVIKDGKLFGRGAIDDKGPAISSVYALLSVIDSGKAPDGGVKLIFGTDEECGSRDLEYYQNKDAYPPMVFTPDGSYPVVNIEKGMIRIRFTKEMEEEPIDLIDITASEVINVVPKTTVATLRGVKKEDVESLIQSDNSDCSFDLGSDNDLITITCTGLGAHASEPNKGKNSLTATLALLSKLNVDSKRFKAVKDLTRIFPHGDFGGKSVGIYSSDEESGETTAAFSMLNINSNTLQGEIDVRYPSSTTKEHIIDTINSRLKQLGFNSTSYLNNDVHKVDKNSRLIKTLLSAYEDLTGLEGYCIAMGGGTYVHEIENGVAFGAEYPGEDYNMHMANEFIPLEELKLNTKLQAEAIVRLATK